MWFLWLLILFIFWIYRIPKQTLYDIWLNHCEVTDLKFDNIYRVSNVFNVCIPFAKYGIDNTLNVVNKLILTSNENRTGSFIFAVEYGSNANIVYLYEKNRIMINTYSNQNITSAVPTQYTCTVQFNHLPYPITLFVKSQNSTFHYYDQEYKPKNATLFNKESCWMQLVLNYIKLVNQEKDNKNQLIY